MAIVQWPDGVELGETVLCVICYQHIPLSKATAGLLYRNGLQAFACNSHFWNSAELILGWVDFLIEQRAKRQPGVEANYWDVSNG